jgi:hypothetical protein
MGSDLVAWVVAIGLGVSVVGLGLRRNLGDATRSWLPRFGEASEQVAATPAPSTEGQGSRELSPRQRRWVIRGYLLFSLCYAAVAVLSTDDRLANAIFAALFALSAVVLLRRRSPSSSSGSTP